MSWASIALERLGSFFGLARFWVLLAGMCYSSCFFILSATAALCSRLDCSSLLRVSMSCMRSSVHRGVILAECVTRWSWTTSSHFPGMADYWLTTCYVCFNYIDSYRSSPWLFRKPSLSVITRASPLSRRASHGLLSYLECLCNNTWACMFQCGR